MGVYNPYQPFILGEEWVPIREENSTFSPAVNVVELGHSFTVTATRRIQDARFYINEMPFNADRGQTYFAAIYPRGKEGESGPVERALIPASAVAVTGGTLTNAATALEALVTQSNNSGVSLDTSIPFSGLAINFSVNAYPQMIDKRILGVNLIIGVSGSDDIMKNGNQSASSILVAQNTVLSGSNPFVLFGRFGEHGLNIQRYPLGEVSQFWSSSVAPFSPYQTSRRMPWTYVQLQRFDNLAGILYALLTTGTSVNSGTIAGSSSCFIYYCALEIFYCDEKRIAFGGEQFGSTFSPTSTGKPFVLGANIIQLESQVPFQGNISGGSGSNVDAVLTPGEYTLTLSSPSVGDLNDTSTSLTTGFPDINALRELYPMPDQPGIQLNIPFPMDETVLGEQFEKLETHILPQLSLHTSGGPLVECHVYGRQATGFVYGTVTADQEVLNPTSVTQAYQSVRFYARRFGDTTVDLSVINAALTSHAHISAADFDALPEVIDGWKEVTIRFDTPTSIASGGTDNIKWSAATETVSNRWEILGATAPALSGIPGSTINKVAAPQQLDNATYGEPSAGSSVNMSWAPGYSPIVNTPQDDPSADAVVLLFQDPAPVSGFAISQQNLALSGIGFNCGVPPEFVPTALAYNRMTWTLDPANQTLDQFERSVAAGSWGVSTGGQTWNLFAPASDFFVSGGQGRITLSTTGGYRISTLGLSTQNMQNVNAYGEISSDTVASGADHWGSLAIRNTTGGTDHLFGEIQWNTDGSVGLKLCTVISSSVTVLGSLIFAQTYVPNTKVKLRMQAIGAAFRGKAWLDGDLEPADWQIQTTTTTNLQAGRVATRSILGGGSPTGITISYDNIVVSEASLGYTELQRMDALDPTWKTIMKATNQGTIFFNDYEARVGILSSYRIRKVNLYEYAGMWSSTVTNTIAAPGVTATSLTANDHVWIFTTNSIQAGTSNLAYALGWEGEVSEDFNFPEASGQSFQTMYGRDFVVAFRPLERGGTNFSRTLLIQAAAISPETLEDFTSLRDMAWTDVPYICLRDEDGNRWFSNVSVPSGRVQRSRRLYMAPVTVVEVTDTPTPVSP